MMALKLEFKLGVKRIMPEIGAQTPEDSPLLCAIIMLTVKMS